MRSKEEEEEEEEDEEDEKGEGDRAKEKKEKIREARRKLHRKTLITHWRISRPYVEYARKDICSSAGISAPT